MEQDFTQFLIDWNGIKLDFDKAYGDQCVDVFKQFNTQVMKGGITFGNAVDYWNNYPTNLYDRISNTPTNQVQEGDVVIWGTDIGPYGHIAVATKYANVNKFISVDENWPMQVDANGNGIGVFHFQTHDYHGVLGWLRPKNFETPSVPTEIITAQSKYDFGVPFGIMEMQAAKSVLHDQANTIISKDVEINQLKIQLQNAQKLYNDLLEQEKSQPNFLSQIGEFIQSLFGKNVKK